MGTSTSDDAAVYKLSEDIALVQTMDFFPPIVDDPYSFGAVAAANSLSDIYAMGARPLIALNIVCFPADLPMELLAGILKGGAEKVAEAGAIIAGGHTIDDEEPKYGLAVTGIVKPGEQLSNATAKAGDHLILTKPIGTGIMVNAIKGRLVGKDAEDGLVHIMSTLNKTASEIMVKIGVNACTDVSGFGLLGHLREMSEGSGLGAVVRLSQVPIIKGVWDMAAKDIFPKGTRRNLKSLEEVVVWDTSLSQEARLVLSDAQTSGGLLMAVPPDRSRALLDALHKAGVNASIIGEMAKDGDPNIQVLP